MTKKKDEVIEKEQTKEGGSVAEKENLKTPDARHPLMNINLNLMDVTHRHVETIEKKKYQLIGSGKSEKECVEEFKEFIYQTLLSVTPRR